MLVLLYYLDHTSQSLSEMFQNSHLNYLEDDILSIMTQRAPDEGTLPLQKFWSQQESATILQSAMIPSKSGAGGVPSI